jgi:hypothetical protein
MPVETPEMFEMQMYHARQICGIVAHVKDRGVASAALRCIGIAAECLTDYKEQDEILRILEKIKKETGWRIDFLMPELKKKWGWNDDYLRQQQMATAAAAAAQNMMHSPPIADFQYNTSSGSSTGAPTPGSSTGSSLPPPPQVPVAPQPAMPQIPRGIVNPLMRTADFNAPTHPYQQYYVAPAPGAGNNEGHYFYRLVQDGNYHHG